jgi:hypothetical protein
MNQDLMIAAFALAGLLIVATAALKGWQDWLALKSREIDLRRGPMEIEGGAREGSARIELADLKERIRKLEAIANGVDI